MTGLGKSLYVKIDLVGSNQVSVFIDKGKWSDRKGVMYIVGIALPLNPCLDMLGAFKQYKLPQEVFSCIEKFIASSGLSAYTKVKVRCPSCGTINPDDIKSCAYCGKAFE